MLASVTLPAPTAVSAVLVRSVTPASSSRRWILSTSIVLTVQADTCGGGRDDLDVEALAPQQFGEDAAQVVVVVVVHHHPAARRAAARP